MCSFSIGLRRHRRPCKTMHTHFIDRKCFFFQQRYCDMNMNMNNVKSEREHASDFHPNRDTVVFSNKRGDDITFVLLI